MITSLKAARRIYRLAESRGRAFDANTYLSLRAENAPADYAIFYARRAYCGQRKAYRPREHRPDFYAA